MPKLKTMQNVFKLLYGGATGNKEAQDLLVQAAESFKALTPKAACTAPEERHRLRALYRGKIDNQVVTKELLAYRTSDKYGKQKWILLCEKFMRHGYKVVLYEAKETHSKYLYINGVFKIRISNHKSATTKEMLKDSDFYVGKLLDGSLQSCANAYDAAVAYFKSENATTVKLTPDKRKALAAIKAYDANS